MCDRDETKTSDNISGDVRADMDDEIADGINAGIDDCEISSDPAWK